MQLDELKAAWAAHGELLQRSLAIDEQLLREQWMRKVRFALAPYVVWRAIEVVLGVAALVVIVPVLVAHAAQLRYLIAGGALVLLFAALSACSAYLVVQALRLDHGGAVTAMQRELERLRVLEYRLLTWAVLGGTVVWLPAVLLGFEALTGIDALARLDVVVLATNVLLGVALLALARWWSKRYVERSDAGPWARRWMNAFSGRGLRVASAHLEELSRFVREESPSR